MTGFGVRDPRLGVRFSDDADDLRKVLGLRARLFRGAAEHVEADADRFDARCRHLMIERRDTGDLVGSLRLLVLPDGAEIASSYAAQFYDLSRLQALRRPMIEVGRVCAAPGPRDPDVLRLALRAVWQVVQSEAAAVLFGCTSFAGTDPAQYRATLALLARRHLAPPRWRPGIKGAARGAEAADCGADRFDFVREAPSGDLPERRAALAGLPPLLRSYLAMGAWVSDHGVIDRDLGTLHVFTAVEIAEIPASRVRLLHLGAG